MPVPLLPENAIPVLATQVDLPMLRALRLASGSDFVMNDSIIDEETRAAFQRLTNLSLVDGALSGSTVVSWTIAHNGTHMLRYFDGQAAQDEDSPPVNNLV